MPSYAIQRVSGDIYSGLITGYLPSTKIPSNALISPASLSSLSNVKDLNLRITPDGLDIVEMTSAEKDLAPADSLEIWRTDKIMELKTNTGVLLAPGIIYNGHTFLLNTTERFMYFTNLATEVLMSQQSNALGLGDWIKTTDYPLNVEKGDNTSYQVTDLTDYMGLFKAVRDRWRAIVQEETTLINSVMLATKFSEIDAVIDNRA